MWFDFKGEWSAADVSALLSSVEDARPVSIVG